MPFLHWFKRKSKDTETEARSNLIDKLTAEPEPTSEPAVADSRKETALQTPPLQRPSAGLKEKEQEPAEDVSVTFPLTVPVPVEPSPFEGVLRPKEPEALRVGPASVATAESDETASGAENRIKLRLQRILSDFPPDLEHPSIQALSDTQAEVALPLDLIQSQLADGRVVVPAETFCKALPVELKHYFEAIDPVSEIPIPLQEIFSRLPPEAIKLREDQELDRPQERIQTPFTGHAEEDARRFSQVGWTIPADKMPQPEREQPEIAVASDSERLQALFMTDEPLDLAKTINKVADLPGLRSCILSTAAGLKLAGDLGDPGREKAISALLPEVFQKTRSKIKELNAGLLETITLSYGAEQLSTFMQGNLCLTVLHDNRPFKPGVREKVQAVISELATLNNSAIEKPL
jgi:hypothetical protein